MNTASLITQLAFVPRKKITTTLCSCVIHGNPLRLSLVLLLLLLFNANNTLWADAHQAKKFPHSKRQYTFGIIPQFKTNRMWGIWHPVIAALQARSGLSITLVIPASIPEFEQRLLQGEFDFAYMNPYQLVLANRAKKYIPLAFDASNQLQGIIVVHKNNTIDNIHQLEGEKMAFPAPNALGASLLVRYELDKKHHITITPKYTKSHDMAYYHVVGGRFIAAGGVQNTLDKQPKFLQNKLKILYKTQRVSAHPIASHPSVTKNNRQLLYQALYAMLQDAQQKKLLSKIPLYNVSPATMQEYKILKNMGLENYYQFSQQPFEVSHSQP